MNSTRTSYRSIFKSAWHDWSARRREHERVTVVTIVLASGIGFLLHWWVAGFPEASSEWMISALYTIVGPALLAAVTLAYSLYLAPYTRLREAEGKIEALEAVVQHGAADWRRNAEWSTAARLARIQRYWLTFWLENLDSYVQEHGEEQAAETVLGSINGVSMTLKLVCPDAGVIFGGEEDVKEMKQLLRPWDLKARLSTAVASIDDVCRIATERHSRTIQAK